MWIKNFFNELKCWWIVRKTYMEHKSEFDKMKIRLDGFGKLVTIINRDPEIELGSDEDEAYLHNETARISNFIVRMKLMDILAYDLSPLDEETVISEDSVEYSHGYKIEFTPAYDLSRQYVTKSSIFWSLFFIALFVIVCLMVISNCIVS